MTRDDFPSIDDLVYIPLGWLISLAANDCVHVGSLRYLMVEWVHPML